MQKTVNAVFRSPAARALVLIALVAPISFSLGTNTVRRGILYYTEVFSASLVAAVAVGLSTWSWRWFWLALIGAVLTAFIQMFMFLFW